MLSFLEELKMMYQILLLVGLSLTSAFPYKKRMQDVAFPEQAGEAIDQGRYNTDQNDRKIFQSEIDFTLPDSEKKNNADFLPINDGNNKPVEGMHAKTSETNYGQTHENSQPVDTEDKKSGFTEIEQIDDKQPLSSDLLHKEEAQNSTFQTQQFEAPYQGKYERKLNDSKFSPFESGSSFSYSIPEIQTHAHSIPKSKNIKKFPKVTYTNKSEIKYGPILEDSQPVDTEVEKNVSKEKVQSDNEPRTDIESQRGMSLLQTYSDEIPVGNKGSMNNYNISMSKFEDNFGLDKDDNIPLGPPMEIIDISPRITNRRYTEKITKGGANKTELVLKYSSGRVPSSKNDDANKENNRQYIMEDIPKIEGNEYPNNRNVLYLLNRDYTGSYDVSKNSSTDNRSASSLEKPYLSTNTTEPIADPYPDRIRILYINHEDLYNNRHTRDDDPIGAPQVIRIPSRKEQMGIASNYSESFRINPSNSKQKARFNDDDVADDLEPAYV